MIELGVWYTTRTYTHGVLYPELEDASTVVMPPSQDSHLANMMIRTIPPPPGCHELHLPHWVDPHTYRGFAERIQTFSAIAPTEAKETWTAGKTVFVTFSEDGRYAGLGATDTIKGAIIQQFDTEPSSIPMNARTCATTSTKRTRWVHPRLQHSCTQSGQTLSRGAPRWRGRITFQHNNAPATVSMQSMTLNDAP